MSDTFSSIIPTGTLRIQLDNGIVILAKQDLTYGEMAAVWEIINRKNTVMVDGKPVDAPRTQAEQMLDAGELCQLVITGWEGVIKDGVAVAFDPAYVKTFNMKTVMKIMNEVVAGLFKDEKKKETATGEATDPGTDGQ